MIIRKFQDRDSINVSKLMEKTLKTTNKNDYSHEYLDDLIKSLSPESIVKRANSMNFYVIEDSNKIVASGAIGPFKNRKDESALFSVFVLPNYQKMGLGRKIIETLEKDELFLSSKRVEVPASITAVDFYIKFGYKYKNGIRKIDNLGLIRLEKFNY